MVLTHRHSLVHCGAGKAIARAGRDDMNMGPDAPLSVLPLSSRTAQLTRQRIFGEEQACGRQYAWSSRFLFECP